MVEREEISAASAPEPRAGRAARWLRRAVGGLVALQLVYLIVGNFFLSSEWGRSIANRRPDRFTAAWSRGRTWLPGWVLLDDLELGGSARRAEWRIQAGRADLWVWLPSLVNRHVRFLRGDARQVAIDVQTLPKPETPRPRKTRRGWRFTLAGLGLDTVTEFAVNEYAIAGEGIVEGWARFQARGPMAFDLARFDFDAAVFRSGDEVAAEPLAVHAVVDIDPVTMGDTSVEEILAGMSGTISIASERAGIGFLERYLANHDWIRLGGEGVLEVALRMTDGWLAPGSFFALAGPVVEAEFAGLLADGVGQVRGEVPVGASYAELTVELSSFGVTRVGDSAQMASGAGLTLRARNDSTAIDRPAEGLSVEVILPRTEVPQLAAFSPYLPPSTGLALTGGKAEIEAEMRYDSASNRGDGRLRLAGERVDATFRELELESRIALDLRFDQVQLASGAAELSGSSLEIDEVRVVRAGASVDEGWWGKLRLPAATVVKPRGLEPLPARLEGLLEAELRDTGPVVALLEGRMPKLGWIDGLLTVENVEGTTEVRAEGRELGLRNLEMTGGAKGRLELLAELEFEERTPEGLFFARWGKLSAALELVEGERDWKLTGSRRWFEEKAAAYRADRPRRARGEGESDAPVAAGVEAEVEEEAK